MTTYIHGQARVHMRSSVNAIQEFSRRKELKDEYDWLLTCKNPDMLRLEHLEKVLRND